MANLPLVLARLRSNDIETTTEHCTDFIPSEESPAGFKKCMRDKAPRHGKLEGCEALRLAPVDLPERIDLAAMPPVQFLGECFGYVSHAPPGSSPSTLVTMNFGDPMLMVCAPKQHFAQDEIQQVEFPDLLGWLNVISDSSRCESAGVRLVEGSLDAVHRHCVEQNRCTPWLFSGLPHKLRVAMRTPAGHPCYGHQASRLWTHNNPEVRDDLLAAVTPVQELRRCNLMYLWSLPPCHGCYTVEDCRQITERLYCGLIGWKHVYGANVRLELHTGNWGCGAFGGNVRLHTMLQMLAATAAGCVDRVIYHSPTARELELAQKWTELLAQVPARETTFDAIFAKLVENRIQWSAGDGQ